MSSALVQKSVVANALIIIMLTVMPGVHVKCYQECIMMYM